MTQCQLVQLPGTLGFEDFTSSRADFFLLSRFQASSRRKTDIAAAMAANGQSRTQTLRAHRQGTTTARMGNQLIGFFEAVLFFMPVVW
jgi:hypothetical protein